MKLRAISKLLRIENCLMAGLAVVIGFVVSGGLIISSGIDIVLFPKLLLAVVSVFVITGAGNAMNDYYDCEADKKNAPHRPLPRGEVSITGAFYLSVSLFIAGIIMSFFINYYCFLLAVMNSFLLFLYAKKPSLPLLGNLMVAYLTASTFVYGALILQIPILNNLKLISLVMLAFFANLGREIIGDIEDITGDKRAGIKTFAITGLRLPFTKTFKLTKNAKETAWFWGKGLIIIAVLMSLIPVKLMGMAYLPIVIIADALFIASIVVKSARQNQKLTKIAIFVGLIAFLAGVLVY